MPTLNTTPRKSLDAALAVLQHAELDHEQATARLAAHVTGQPGFMRLNIRVSTTRKALRTAAEAYRAAQVVYAAAYPAAARRLFGTAA